MIGTSAVLLVALAGAAVSAVDRSRGAVGARRLLHGAHAASAGAAGHDHPLRGDRRLPRRRDHLPCSLQVDGLRRLADGGQRLHRRARRSAAPEQGRKVLAYTHGTVGVASNCAPSLAKPARRSRSSSKAARHCSPPGYVIASSDYQGLGTPGPHPYLVGASEAMNELDAVRAAHNLVAGAREHRLRRLGPLAGRPGCAVHGPARRDATRPSCTWSASRQAARCRTSSTSSRSTSRRRSAGS